MNKFSSTFIDANGNEFNSSPNYVSQESPILSYNNSYNLETIAVLSFIIITLPETVSCLSELNVIIA